ncbi:MAG TPA: glycosyltransferase family 39 protein [Candidatus Paceibacterota bacterium]|nr:glycosyltransferase family 39 protein [Candidatus Paceibacterota bacterium]
MTFIRTYRVEIALAVLALVVHAACFALVIHANGSVLDAVRADDGFFELAKNVLAGNGFSWSAEAPYEPNAMRTPGYSYVLAALIGVVGVAGAALIQMLAASAIPILGMKIAEKITASRAISIGTGVILALDPTLALLSFQFYTETLFLILFLLWLLLTFRYLERRDALTLILGAILLGFAILTRTTVQYIPLLFVPFIFWQFGRKEWWRGATHAGVYLLIIGAILTPWVMRNVHEFGVPGLSAQTPFVLYTNLAPAVLSVAKGSDFNDEVRGFLTPAEYKGDAITLVNGADYAARAFDVVYAHPTAAAFVASKSLFTFFTNDGFYALLARSGYAPEDFFPLLVAARLAWIAITLAAFVGALVYLLTRRSQLAILIILLVAYFALTSTIAAFGTNPRYRLPVDPIILALAGIGCAYLFALLRRRTSIWPHKPQLTGTTHRQNDSHRAR